MITGIGRQCARAAAAVGLTFAGTLAVMAPGGAATVTPHAESAAPAAVRCVWADAAHPKGDVVAAGGMSFTCGTDSAGAPYWFRGAASGPSTVPNPGAGTAPAGHFSAGARQPGTDYTDYCVGDQLIEGRGDVYEVVPGGNGLMYWRAAAPVSSWVFDHGDRQAPPSRHSSGSCQDGQLI